MSLRYILASIYVPPYSNWIAFIIVGVKYSPALFITDNSCPSVSIFKKSIVETFSLEMYDSSRNNEISV